MKKTIGENYFYLPYLCYSKTMCNEFLELTQHSLVGDLLLNHNW